eukprot:31306-Pelagococcus_subviridis.AAC.4
MIRYKRVVPPIPKRGPLAGVELRLLRLRGGDGRAPRPDPPDDPTPQRAPQDPHPAHDPHARAHQPWFVNALREVDAHAGPERVRGARDEEPERRQDQRERRRRVLEPRQRQQRARAQHEHARERGGVSAVENVHELSGEDAADGDGDGEDVHEVVGDDLRPQRFREVIRHPEKHGEDERARERARQRPVAQPGDIPRLADIAGDRRDGAGPSRFYPGRVALDADAAADADAAEQRQRLAEAVAAAAATAATAAAASPEQRVVLASDGRARARVHARVQRQRGRQLRGGDDEVHRRPAPPRRVLGERRRELHGEDVPDRAARHPRAQDDAHLRGVDERARDGDDVRDRERLREAVDRAQRAVRERDLRRRRRDGRGRHRAEKDPGDRHRRRGEAQADDRARQVAFHLPYRAADDEDGAEGQQVDGVHRVERGRGEVGVRLQLRLDRGDALARGS